MSATPVVEVRRRHEDDPPAGARQVVEPSPVAGDLLALAVPQALVLDRQPVLRPGEVDPARRSRSPIRTRTGRPAGQVGAVDQQPEPRLLRGAGEPVGELRDPADVGGSRARSGRGGRPDLARGRPVPARGTDPAATTASSSGWIRPGPARCASGAVIGTPRACGDLRVDRTAGSGARRRPRPRRSGGDACTRRRRPGRRAPRPRGLRRSVRTPRPRHEQAGDGEARAARASPAAGAGVDVREEAPPRGTPQLVRRSADPSATPSTRGTPGRAGRRTGGWRRHAGRCRTRARRVRRRPQEDAEMRRTAVSRRVIPAVGRVSVAGAAPVASRAWSDRWGCRSTRSNAQGRRGSSTSGPRRRCAPRPRSSGSSRSCSPASTRRSGRTT